MKRSSPIKSFLLVFFLMLYTFSNAQIGYKIELNGELSQLQHLILDLKDQIQIMESLKDSYTSSLELRRDDFSGSTIVYTKPIRRNHGPDIQMIAVRSSGDSETICQIRIELFTREGSIHMNRVHIRSMSKVYEFKLKKYDSEKNTENCVFHCWCNHNSAGLEGYTYTIQLTVSEEDFFRIISSERITVGFSNMLIPDKGVSNDDTSKMNELYEYLMASRNIDRINIQLMDAINRFQEVRGLLNNM